MQGREYDEWLPPGRTPPYRPKISRVGEKGRVELRNHWRDALVVSLELGPHLIRYDEFPDTDDERGDPQRLRENY